jgi:thiol:disulfide interchange protein
MSRIQLKSESTVFSTFLLLFFLLSSISLSCSNSSQTSYSSSPIKWETDYQTALQKAAQSNKPIVVDLYTVWCHWCKKLDEDVWSDNDIVAFSKGQVYLKLNAEESEDGRRLAEKFKVRGYPTVVILNHKGEEINKIIGYMPADKYLKELKNVLSAQ